jgi:dethiobiotin synthetase
VNYFITGTDTDVGKTYFTALLTRALRSRGLDTLALKPICCGPRDDVILLRHAADLEVSEDVLNPLWFTAPAAPLVAAREDGREVSLAALQSWYADLRSQRRSLLVEGAGGWLVPVTRDVTVADLAVAFQLPVLVVVANRLGCLNHALLTVESIRARGLTCAGLVLNTLSADDSIAAATNRAILEEVCDVPIRAEITLGQTSLAWVELES